MINDRYNATWFLGPSRHIPVPTAIETVDEICASFYASNFGCMVRTLRNEGTPPGALSENKGLAAFPR